MKRPEYRIMVGFAVAAGAFFAAVLISKGARMGNSSREFPFPIGEAVESLESRAQSRMLTNLRSQLLFDEYAKPLAIPKNLIGKYEEEVRNYMVLAPWTGKEADSQAVLVAGKLEEKLREVSVASDLKRGILERAGKHFYNQAMNTQGEGASSAYVAKLLRLSVAHLNESVK